MNDTRLDEIFGRIGEQHGVRSRGAEFYPYKEMKSTWSGERGAFWFRVPDYLDRASTEVLEDYVTNLLRQVRERRVVQYGPQYLDYIRSEAFLRAKRPVYVERAGNMSNRSAGRTYDLQALYEGLRDRGMVEEVNPLLNWTVHPNRAKVGYANMIFKTVTISSALDAVDVPEFVAEYVLYHELLHLEQELGRKVYHDPLFRIKEKRYPRAAEAERYLRQVHKGEVGNRPAALIVKRLP